VQLGTLYTLQSINQSFIHSNCGYIRARMLKPTLGSKGFSISRNMKYT